MVKSNGGYLESGDIMITIEKGVKDRDRTNKRRIWRPDTLGDKDALKSVEIENAIIANDRELWTAP